MTSSGIRRAAGLGVLAVFLLVGTTQWIENANTGLMNPLVEKAYADEKKATPEMIEKGKSIYATLCVSCHGLNGDGKGPVAAALTPKPADFTDGQWEHGGSPQKIYDTITKGIPGTTMVPFGGQLSEEDRWAVVFYVKSFSK